MSNLVEYRFLPWTRRGLASQVQIADSLGTLQARANVKVAITVTGAGLSEIDLNLYGPGDVIGIDPRLIVRLSPRPNSADAEPNYFTAVDFDPPDFPWMFTPAKAGANERLRPWIVLIVVDAASVGQPRPEAGLPLPVLTIPAAVSLDELPDLTDSWAWAHTQVTIDQSDASPLAQHLEANPVLNISRLVCPRHLEANKRYYACLVPAFDAGVQRGLGGEPEPEAQLGPAWNASAGGEIRLPVYFHWEFTTGPQGDFESLARRLVPIECPPTVGYTRMFIGEPGDPLQFSLPAADQAAYTQMDGALRPLENNPQSLEEIASGLQNEMEDLLNLAFRKSQNASAKAGVLGPPIYAEWHARQHSVPTGQPVWMRTLNLDPRARVAAGLGAEVVRANQEAFMQSAWEQVDRVIQANERLNYGRLSLELLRSLHERNFKPLPNDRLLHITSPLHARTLQGESTVRANIARTSLPDASLDPAMRRLASPQRALLKNAARRAKLTLPPSASFRSGLLKSLAAGRSDVDPTPFAPDGLLGVRLIENLNLGAADQIDLHTSGLPISADAGALTRIRSRSDGLQAIDFRANPVSMSLRADLRSTGLVVGDHLSNLLELGEVTEAVEAKFNLHQTLRELVKVSKANPNAPAYLVTAGKQELPLINALDVDSSGQVVVRTPANQPVIVIGKIDPALFASQRGNLSSLLSKLEPGILDASGAKQVLIESGLVRRPVIRPILSETLPGVLEAAVPQRQPSNTLPPLVKDTVAINRYESAFATLTGKIQLGQAGIVPQLVSFALNGANAAPRLILTRIDPLQIVPHRISSLIALPAIREGIEVSADMDRIMVAPDLPAPAYSYLTAYDRDRFLPGVEAIPPNAITLLETNPRFIEAFLVGMNHEMNRELLWRGYPTDRMGTPFRYFWGWMDGNPDIKPIHQWSKAVDLGRNSRGRGPGGQVVLLVRGDLLRRYPNTVIFAWKAVRQGGVLRLVNPPDPLSELKKPVFGGRFDPDYTFYGFELTDSDLAQGDGWFFVLQEQPTEPRFGFDEPDPANPDPPQPADFNEIDWGQVGPAPGDYLRLSSSSLLNPAGAGKFAARNGARLARIALQQPMRVAVHSGKISRP